jgi:hypothetical protein
LTFNLDFLKFKGKKLRRPCCGLANFKSKISIKAQFFKINTQGKVITSTRTGIYWYTLPAFDENAFLKVNCRIFISDTGTGIYMQNFKKSNFVNTVVPFSVWLKCSEPYSIHTGNFPQATY